MINTLRILLFSLIFSLVTTSCGGGGGGSVSDNPGTGTTPPPAASTAVPPATLNAMQGQVLLGPVVDASIEIYDATDLDGPTVCAVSSSSIDAETGPGVVDLSECSFDDAKLYYFIVRGGEDIDVDDDGELDDTPTSKQGVLHAILSGAQINTGGWRLNILTELAYQNSLSILISNPNKEAIANRLDSSAKQLLKLDLNNDGVINADDLAQFLPQDHFDSLINPDADLIASLLASIHEGNSLDTNELSRQYLLGATDQVIFGHSTDGFFNFDYLFDNGLLYMVGGVPDQPGSVAEGHLALRIYNSQGSGGISLQSSLDVTGLDSGIFDKEIQVKKSGDLLYLAAGSAGLLIFDVSVPDSPQHIGTYEPGSSVDLVEINDSIVYLGTYFDGISALDASDPESLVLLGTLSTTVFNMVYRDNRLFVYGGGISVLDVSDPGNMLLLDSISFSGGSGEPLELKGDLLYIRNNDEFHQIKVFDVSDTTNIIEINQVPTPSYVSDMLIDGDYLYVLQSSNGNNHALNTYHLDNTGGLELIDSRLALAGTGKLVLGTDSVYLSSPVQLNAYAKSALNQASNNLLNIPTRFDAKRLKLISNRAYVADGTTLRIYDVTSPESQISELGSIQLVDFIEDIDVSDGYVYLANRADGLTIIDISDPTSPIVVAQEHSLNIAVDVSYNSSSIAVVNNTAYTTIDGLDKLVAFDVSDPTHPVLLDTQINISIVSYALVPFGNLLYRVSNAGLDIIDIADRLNMSYVETKQIIGTDLSFFDETIGYMSTAEGEIRVIDFTNGKSPVQLSTALGLGQGTGIAAVGDVVYMSNSFGLINVFDVSDLAAPVYLSQFKVNGVVTDVAATDDYVFATNGFGLVVEHAVQTVFNLD
ncbi:hypothetical protein N9451_00165 [bacterium]|nr:hypothetical protein [bacterium]